MCDTKNTIRDYDEALARMWILCHFNTVYEKVKHLYAFKEDTYNALYDFVDNHYDFLKPIVERRMRVEVTMSSFLCKLNEKVWDKATLDAAIGFTSDYARYMNEYDIDLYDEGKEFQNDVEKRKIDSIHVKRLLHKVFPDLPYGFDENKDWPTESDDVIDPRTVPELPYYK